MNQHLTPTLFAILMMLSNASFSQINFLSGSFSSAKTSAISSNIPFMTYVGEAWCLPCQIMEETTFQSEAVANALEGKYHAYKVNFDDSEAEEWKDEFDLCCLPTFLFFNEEAELLTKVERPLTSTALVSILEDPTVPLPPINAGEVETSLATSAITKSNPSNLADQEENLRIYFEKVEDLADELIQYAEKTEVKNSTASKTVVLENTASPLEDTSMPLWNIQVGYYKQFENAIQKSERMKRKYHHRFSIVESYKNNEVHYRVLMGEFKNLSEAKKVYKIVKRNGDRAAIKKRSLL